MRGRSEYNPIASSDVDGDVDVVPAENSGNSDATSGDRRRNNNNHNYSRVSAGDDDSGQEGIRSTQAKSLRSKTSSLGSKNTSANSSLVDSMDEDAGTGHPASDSETDRAGGERINVIILDSAQKRFPVKVHPDWTIQKFKKVGAKIHKVPPSAQRLIFRGRMLEDSKTLNELGISEEDVIVHLFPKPRVVITSSSSTENVSASGGGSEDEEEGGAHIPQIVLDEEEQERRGQILVLGSYEIAEAQNNVRLMSLLLGTICAMRLLTLLSIASGADEVPVYEDDIPDGGNHTDDGMYPAVDYETREWENQDYIDLFVSSVCFFVARLGMVATHENTSRLASHYLVGTLIAGILWNLWDVLEFVVIVKEEAAKDDDTYEQWTGDEYRSLALFVVFLPLGVWLVCCARAWQFRHLIEEAELEAAQRIRNELNLDEVGDNMDSDDDDDDGDDDDRQSDDRSDAHQELNDVSSNNRLPTIV